jgi:hypothetical protein
MSWKFLVVPGGERSLAGYGDAGDVDAAVTHGDGSDRVDKRARLGWLRSQRR